MWNSNYSGRLSHVSSPHAMIPSSRSLFSATNAYLLTWNTSGLQDIVYGDPFLRLIHSEIILKECTRAQHEENEDQFHKPQGQEPFSQEMTNKI